MVDKGDARIFDTTFNGWSEIYLVKITTQFERVPYTALQGLLS